MKTRSPTGSSLQPLPYQITLRDFLRTQEPELWNWFAQARREEAADEALRLELLKQTYRLDRSAHPDLYRTADAARERLGVSQEAVLYQAQQPQGGAAGIMPLLDAPHIVLHGPVEERLAADEMQALLAHELSHYLLWQWGAGDLLLVEELLAAVAPSEEHPEFAESARRFQLYSEIYCDRGALAAVGELDVVVSLLIKSHTDVSQADPQAYLRQAAEIFGAGPIVTAGISHPEAFIRARALELHSQTREDPSACEADIARMIEGPIRLESLDLLGQHRIADATRRLLDALLAPVWMRTAPVVAQATGYFDDFRPGDRPAELAVVRELLEPLPEGDSEEHALADYFTFVLLDFVAVDRDLEEAPLALATQIADEIGLTARLEQRARRELKLRKKQFERVAAEAPAILAAAGSQNP